jgi:nucleoside-diphosphate-sugar epimerase
MSVLIKFDKRLAQGLSPVIYGDGIQKRDFISIVDVVYAISVKMMENLILYNTYLRKSMGTIISLNPASMLFLATKCKSSLDLVISA